VALLCCSVTASYGSWSRTPFNRWLLTGRLSTYPLALLYTVQVSAVVSFAAPNKQVFVLAQNNTLMIWNGNHSIWNGNHSIWNPYEPQTPTLPLACSWNVFLRDGKYLKTFQAQHECKCIRCRKKPMLLMVKRILCVSSPSIERNNSHEVLFKIKKSYIFG
jgi:hypothetical protein